MIPSSGVCTLAFGETQRGEVRRASCLPFSSLSASLSFQRHHHHDHREITVNMETPSSESSSSSSSSFSSSSGRTQWLIWMVLRISLIIVIISIMNMIREDTVIDLDGPGPLPPFSVTCYKSGTGFTTAIRSKPILSQWQRRWRWWCQWWQWVLLRHDNEEMTKVDGFQEPGSFRQVIVIVYPFFFLSCHLIHLPFPHCKLLA